MLPSIFSMVTGSWRRHESEDRPVPKSSSATRTQSPQALHQRLGARQVHDRGVLGELETEHSGSRPLEATLSIRKSEK